jgi:hypothetical protein
MQKVALQTSIGCDMRLVQPHSWLHCIPTATVTTKAIALFSQETKAPTSTRQSRFHVEDMTYLYKWLEKRQLYEMYFLPYMSLHTKTTQALTKGIDRTARRKDRRSKHKSHEKVTTPQDAARVPQIFPTEEICEMRHVVCKSRISRNSAWASSWFRLASIDTCYDLTNAATSATQSEGLCEGVQRSSRIPVCSVFCGSQIVVHFASHRFDAALNTVTPQLR